MPENENPRRTYSLRGLSLDGLGPDGEGLAADRHLKNSRFEGFGLVPWRSYCVMVSERVLAGAFIDGSFEGN
jgi:hypothetical protein